MYSLYVVLIFHRNVNGRSATVYGRTGVPLEVQRLGLDQLDPLPAAQYVHDSRNELELHALHEPAAQRADPADQLGADPLRRVRGELLGAPQPLRALL